MPRSNPSVSAKLVCFCFPELGDGMFLQTTDGQQFSPENAHPDRRQPFRGGFLVSIILDMVGLVDYTVHFEFACPAQGQIVFF